MNYMDLCYLRQCLSVDLEQWFPKWGTCTPGGTRAACRGYVKKFQNYVKINKLDPPEKHGLKSLIFR